MALQLNEFLTYDEQKKFYENLEKNNIDSYLTKDILLYTYYEPSTVYSITNYIINYGSRDSVIKTLNSAKDDYLNDILGKINNEYTTTYEVLIEKYPNDEEIMDIIKDCTPPKLFDKVKDIKMPFIKNKEFKYNIKDQTCIRYTDINGKQKFITFIGDKRLEHYKTAILDKPTETGVYCWVYYTNTKGEQQFSFAKVENEMELNTSHNAILNKLDDVVYIHIAGEMYYNAEKEGKQTCYNFLSGTYAMDIFVRYKDKFNISAIESDFKEIIRNYLGNNIPKCEPELETLINITLTPITKEILNEYTYYGNVHITDNRDDCVNINRYYTSLSNFNIPTLHEIIKNHHRQRMEPFEQLVRSSKYTPTKEFIPEQLQEEKLENLKKETSEKIKQINKQVEEVKNEVLSRSERIAQKRKAEQTETQTQKKPKKFGRSIRKFRKFHRSLRKKHIKKNL